MTGTYQWDASYSGDTNNNAASDNADANEQVTVSAASPTIASPHPDHGHAGHDPADLDRHGRARGRLPPDRHDHLHAVPQRRPTPVDTETATVTGNGTYTTPIGFTLPTTGTVTGTYQWVATYSGDGNNNTASDTGSVAEQVTVEIESPTVTPTPTPTPIPTPTPDPTVTSLRRFGFHEQRTQFVLTFGSELDPCVHRTSGITGWLRSVRKAISARGSGSSRRPTTPDADGRDPSGPPGLSVRPLPVCGQRQGTRRPGRPDRDAARRPEQRRAGERLRQGLRPSDPGGDVPGLPREDDPQGRALASRPVTFSDEGREAGAARRILDRADRADRLDGGRRGPRPAQAAKAVDAVLATTSSTHKS